MTELPAAVISDACVLIETINVEQTRVLRLVTNHKRAFTASRKLHHFGAVVMWHHERRMADWMRSSDKFMAFKTWLGS